jgi:hypothetical protein
MGSADGEQRRANVAARIEDQFPPTLSLSSHQKPKAYCAGCKLNCKVDIEQRCCRPAVEHDAEQPPEREREHEEYRPNEAGGLPFRRQCRHDPECRACEIKAHQRAEDLALVRSLDIEFEELRQYARRICAIAQRHRNEADRNEQEIDLHHWSSPNENYSRFGCRGPLHLAQDPGVA